MKEFGTTGYGTAVQEPDGLGFVYLQRFLLACTICRPVSTLQLRGLKKFRDLFLLDNDIAIEVALDTEAFLKAGS